MHMQYICMYIRTIRTAAETAKGIARLSSTPLTEIVFCGWQIKCKYFCYAGGAFIIVTPEEGWGRGSVKAA